MSAKPCRTKEAQHRKLNGPQMGERGRGVLDPGQMCQAVAEREEEAVKKRRLRRGTWRAAMGQDE